MRFKFSHLLGQLSLTLSSEKDETAQTFSMSEPNPSKLEEKALSVLSMLHVPMSTISLLIFCIAFFGSACVALGPSEDNRSNLSTYTLLMTCTILYPV